MFQICGGITISWRHVCRSCLNWRTRPYGLLTGGFLSHIKEMCLRLANRCRSLVICTLPSVLPAQLPDHEALMRRTGGIKPPIYIYGHSCHLYFGWLAEVVILDFSALAKLVSKPPLPSILTLMWLVTWFPKRQIWSLVSRHGRSFKVLIELWCFLLWTWPIPTRFSPFSTLEGLTRGMPTVDYTSRSHQIQTARLLTLRHLSEKWTQTRSRALGFISVLHFVSKEVLRQGIANKAGTT